MTDCSHDEAHILTSDEHGNTLTRVIPGHDCAYVDWRNAHINTAMLRAVATGGPAGLCRRFMEEMDRACGTGRNVRLAS